MDWNQPLVVGLVTASLAGAATVAAALIGLLGGGGGGGGGGGHVVSGTGGSALAIVTVTWAPRAQAELAAIVEGSAHGLQSGDEVYVIARPSGDVAAARSAAAAAAATASSSAGRWFASDGVQPGADGRWRAEIVISRLSSTPLTFEAVEMAGAAQPVSAPEYAPPTVSSKEEAPASGYEAIPEPRAQAPESSAAAPVPTTRSSTTSSSPPPGSEAGAAAEEGAGGAEGEAGGEQKPHVAGNREALEKTGPKAAKGAVSQALTVKPPAR